MKNAISLLVALNLAAAGCSSATSSPPASPTPSAPAPQPGAMTAAEIDSVYNARIQADRMRFKPEDVQFISGMIHHHAQALDMAGLVPDRTTNSALRTLAARIINAQKDEINLMQNLLRVRDQPVPEVHETDGRLMVHGSAHPANMPGMASPEEMQQLAQSKGTAFDRLFLTLMIRHHKGAVDMVRHLNAVGAGQDDSVYKFAHDVQADQTAEIARMQRMLASLPGRNP